MSSLAELQAEIVAERASRGFTSDPGRLLALLVEEVGEVARELTKTWSPNDDDFEVERLACELADVLVLVCALASAHGVDLDHSVRHKFFEVDADRTWKSAPK
ncbi:MAG: MazG nucleotide pyrophosphohydrolase domain-containing protein [Acidimicrobiia bacterium]